MTDSLSVVAWGSVSRTKVTGASQVRPPFVERVTETAFGPLPPFGRLFSNGRWMK